MVREIDNISRVPAYFATDVEAINEGQDLDVEGIVANLNAQLNNWCGRGSGYVLERITRFVISVTKYRPLQGSGPDSNGTYIVTPKFIQNKKCTINIQNSDDLCFAWSVLAAIYPPKNHPDSVYSYSKYIGVLNLHGLQFPLQLKDISKFERQNLTIFVNVLYWDEESRSFTAEYLSTE